MGIRNAAPVKGAFGREKECPVCHARFCEIRKRGRGRTYCSDECKSAKDVQDKASRRKGDEPEGDPDPDGYGCRPGHGPEWLGYWLPGGLIDQEGETAALCAIYGHDDGRGWRITGTVPRMSALANAAFAEAWPGWVPGEDEGQTNPRLPRVIGSWDDCRKVSRWASCGWDARMARGLRMAAERAPRRALQAA